MSMEKAEALLKRIQKKDYKPIYLLHGEKETYFVDLISSYIEKHVLTEDQKAFNQIILYGKDTDVEELINSAKRYPMMAEHQVIILREAQDLKNIEKLESYANNPQLTTILVLCFKHKKVDGRKKVFKTIKSKYEHFQTGNIYESDVLKWINNTLRKAGYAIQPKASKMLIENLGNSLSNIDKELEKLKQILPDSTTILPKHIEDYVGISKDYNIFELNNAIGVKNEFKAQRIVKYFAENQKNHPMVLTLGTIYNFFNKILIYHSLTDKSKPKVAKALGVHPFFVNDYVQAARHYSMKNATRAIELVRITDAQGKGIGITPALSQGLLKNLLTNIIRL